MSTQTQTETIVLQTRASTEAIPTEHDISHDSRPPEPKWMYIKILSAGLSFFVAGVNDGSLGSIIPYVLRTYNIGTNMVAVLYGTTFFGWLIAALTNGKITQYLDLGPILSLGAAIQILAQVLRVWEPPFALYAVTFFLASLGQAYNDTHANTFVSALNGAHRWLGFIHAMYMAGCLVGPFVATGVASANVDSKWYLFYLFPLGVGVMNLVFVGVSFRDRMVTPTVLRGQRRGMTASNSALKEIKDTLSTPGVWLLSLFFFFFLGASITAGGWMVEYLVNVRNGDVKEMGYVPAGFYGGAFLGRLILAEPTHRLGERRMIFVYALLCVGLQLVFWLVPNIITEAVAVSLLGFFSGPFFATGISVGSKIFSPEIRSSAIAFVFVLGQIGGSVFPALTGIIAAQVGVQVLQPMLVGLLGAAGVSWLILPKDTALHQD
ncbi:Major facilitator superfamily domain, general substrate transporter [Penicillium expansum]|uniref:Major facilitator superfamily domain, general substrate transporter n=1 Tax=Penicillium expansum TaxID=27334 RepID=A0A0A2KK19_PENEN|nr:Major facilitator superfamily domain, general substrate transporter [Penicillium expansum]KGO43904.1 Major facilitator superfamily domain, general substrate transporter [Penicillium expansum]KGO63016.1 Major facilitator superfamily domain, general substrate transporter [Penicillium expansum]KGO67246.1 Major facilitator superfamily domain, general substrate transporter [Penicillium expansum]